MIDFARASSHQLRDLPPIGRAPVCNKCLRAHYRFNESATLSRNDGYCDECAAVADERLARGAYGGDPSAFVPAERLRVSETAGHPEKATDCEQHPY